MTFSDALTSVFWSLACPIAAWTLHTVSYCVASYHYFRKDLRRMWPEPDDQEATVLEHDKIPPVKRYPWYGPTHRQVSYIVANSVVSLCSSFLVYQIVPETKWIPLYDLCYVCCKMYFITDAFLYFFHRLFHTKYLYVYHSIHHESRRPDGYLSQYSHPLEFFWCNLIPVYAGGYLSGLNWSYFVVWCMIATINGVISHSGYKGMASFHDYHHINQTVNFGVGGFCDWLFGTYGGDVERRLLSR